MAVAALVLLINGITVTVLLATDGASKSSQGVNGVFDHPQATSALDLAEEQALGVVSLDASSGEAELAALSNRTTAKFRTDFTGFAESLLDDVRAEGLEVRSRVAVGGIAEMSADRATVIVATSGSSSTTTSPEPRSRDLQMRVVVTWIDDDWRVDDLEFL
ncbi:hypothetical protein GCM10027020_35680 [Nocardioides salsibiostraticola]